MNTNLLIIYKRLYFTNSLLRYVYEYWNNYFHQVLTKRPLSIYEYS